LPGVPTGPPRSEPVALLEHDTQRAAKRSAGPFPGSLVTVRTLAQASTGGSDHPALCAKETIPAKRASKAYRWRHPFAGVTCAPAALALAGVPACAVSPRGGPEERQTSAGHTLSGPRPVAWNRQFKKLRGSRPSRHHSHRRPGPPRSIPSCVSHAGSGIRPDSRCRRGPRRGARWQGTAKPALTLLY
jgi:hypothetical protein